VLAIAASLGYSASVIRRRMRESSGGPPPRGAPVARASWVFQKDVPTVPAAPVEPVVRRVRARAVDLSVYSKFNFVARRIPGVPRPVLLDPADILRFSRTELSPVTFTPASMSFRLMFPVHGTENSSAESPALRKSELAMAVYAETGGLFPKKISRGSVYDPAYWVSGFGPGGAGDLLLARRMIAETRKGNKRTHLKAFPVDLHPLHLLSWYPCAEAAEDVIDAEVYTLPPGTRLHFFIRQDGVGRQKAAYLKNSEPVLSFGPFVNVGGGDVPAGDKTYIDFYVLPVR
jgi:hypothetical protein